MRKLKLRALAGVGLAAALVVASSTSAMAAVDTSRLSTTIVGEGSDNTYEVMNDLD
jgi:ABC-type phosphate transport system substrate-binding protein